MAKRSGKKKVELLVKASKATKRAEASYFRGNKSAFLKTWKPNLRETSEDVRASWQDAASRAIDAFQNSGFIAGIIEAAASATVGSGLTLSSQPDAAALGWTEEEAAEWADEVERGYLAWSTDPIECDAAGRMTFGQMQDAAFKGWFFYGEILSLLPIFQRAKGGSFTKVSLLPPSRLVRKSDGLRKIDGITVDAWGMAQSYSITMRDATGMRVEREHNAFDRDGRRKVSHVFEPSIQGYRGISPLAPVLKVVNQFDQFQDATLTTALLQTIFAATVKSNLSGIRAFDGLMTENEAGQSSLNLAGYTEARSTWYDDAQIDLTQHGRIAHLFPNEELDFKEAKHPSATYDLFVQWLLREICICAGVTYTAGTNDSRNATYSSVRMDTAVNWGVVLRRRSFIVSPFCQAVFSTWLEDSIGMGKISFPGGLDAFLANRSAATKSSWNGPAQPQADDLKTARAFQALKDMGVFSISRISEAYGIDPENEQRQRARERKTAEKLGLPDPHADPNVDPAFNRDEQGDNEDKADDPSFVPDPGA